MNDKRPLREVEKPPTDNLSETIGKKAVRKRKAARNKNKNIWFGFSVFGLIGWSIALPCILGAGLGWWLDMNYPRTQSWTLMLLLAGLTLGCFNAWRWLEVERKKINKLEDDDDGNT